MMMQKFALLLLMLLASRVLTAQDQDGIYRKYTGTIGKKSAVSVDLYFTDSLVTGHFYYLDDGNEIQLLGGIDELELNLSEKTRNVNQGMWSGSVSADFTTIEGTWNDASKSKDLPFKLTLSQPEGSIAVSSVTDDFSYTWQRNATGASMGCKAVYTYCYLPDIRNNPVAKTINEELLDIDLVGNETPVMIKSIAASYMDDEFDSFVESYQETFPDSVAAENRKYMNETPSLYQWKYKQVYSVLFNEHNLITFGVSEFTHNGGAENYDVTSYLVFNLQDGESVSLDDLFKRTALKDLSMILERQFRTEHQISEDAPLSKAGLTVKRIQVKDDFYVDHGGIGFTYNPGEIAPDAEGKITIYLKWEQLKELIDPDGMLAWVL